MTPRRLAALASTAARGTLPERAAAAALSAGVVVLRLPVEQAERPLVDFVAAAYAADCAVAPDGDHVRFVGVGVGGARALATLAWLRELCGRALRDCAATPKHRWALCYGAATLLAESQGVPLVTAALDDAARGGSAFDARLFAVALFAQEVAAQAGVPRPRRAPAPRALAGDPERLAALARYRRLTGAEWQLYGRPTVEQYLAHYLEGARGR